MILYKEALRKKYFISFDRGEKENMVCRKESHDRVSENVYTAHMCTL